MNTPTQTSLRPIISEIRISTNLSPHPEFAKNPEKFADERNLGHIYCTPPETFFKTDYKSSKKLATQKSNIFIGDNKAISLFLEDDERPCITSIKVEPPKLLHPIYETNHYSSDYLHEAIRIMKSQVTPLLVSSVDAQKMIPSSASDKDCSYFSKLEVKAFHKDIRVSHLHNFSHPLTGPAAGSTENRIELVSSQKNFSILFEDKKWNVFENGRLIPCEGTVVTLTLKQAELARQFPFSAIRRMGKTNRLVDMKFDDVSKVYSRLMSQLEGIYLPLPLKWLSIGKKVTNAKVIALCSKITAIPAIEMQSWDQEIRNPSESTIDRFKHEFAAAIAALNEIPAAQIFSYSDKN